ncbi:arginine--tRNA ligase [Aedoeadaptatus nemausensis]|uniref:Arginine--tRNA ligase n=1 Tax=Aedoeadaptatus nemausensis TaxID=2582829 RepID=A0A6V6XYK0_9FIRM|nr:arginine--tRNA ligase [Peptoniphilus nemausensis]CAC9922450.1 arginine--tRNA ligase [Peptoniphilus nemausensis]
MINFKEQIAEGLARETGLDAKDLLYKIETPPDRKMGDYAFPTFTLAKTMRKNPAVIAQELKDKLSDVEGIREIAVAGPYLNFFIDTTALAENVLKAVLEEGDRFGSSDLGKGKTAIVEYSSPNIAKPFHIGHIRTTIIGDSIKRIYKHLGYNVEAINHLGDYGTQFGMMIEAYKLWGDDDIIEKNPIPELVKLYVRINQEAETNKELLDNSREWFRKLESGDEEAVALWQWFRDLSLDEFKRVYDMLDVDFDSYRGESYYSDLMLKAVDEIKEKGLLIEDQGAQIINLDKYNLPPAIIIKSDGSTIYLTRDIATAIFRKDTYDFYKNIYVVGSQQNLHFQQLKAILKEMGYDWADDCVHVPFGMVSLPEGTLSTRRGKVVYLEDVLNRATEKVDDILREREEKNGYTMENREELARQVGIGAVKFQELFNQRIKDYVFDWDRTLSFDGETGPYVQYTHARMHSLLEKGNFDPSKEVDVKALTLDDEKELLQQLYGFNQVIVDSHEKYEPYLVTRYITECAKTFNKYYTNTPILVEDEEVKNARLLLVYGVKNMIKIGLNLLGIEAPGKM